MKKITLTCFSVLFVLAVVAQKQINDPNAQTRSVQGFHAIKVSSGIDLFLTQGNTEAVAVSASNPDDRNKIITEVVDGTLRIRYDESYWRFWKIKNRNLKAYVSVVNIDKINISSGSDVKVDGSLKSTAFNINISSGASFDGRVEATSMNVDQSSGSKVSITGSAGDIAIDGSSGSHFYGFDFVVNNCSVSTSSGAKIEITVNRELTVDARSGGHVYYKGSGVIRNMRASSGGNVSKKS